ncbi:DNA helicase [Tanacetum coccineum]
MNLASSSRDIDCDHGSFGAFLSYEAKHRLEIHFHVERKHGFLRGVSRKKMGKKNWLMKGFRSSSHVSIVPSFSSSNHDSEEFVNVFMRIGFSSTIKLVSFDYGQLVTFNGKFVCGFRNSDCEAGSQSDNMVGSPDRQFLGVEVDYFFDRKELFCFVDKVFDSEYVQVQVQVQKWKTHFPWHVTLTLEIVPSYGKTMRNAEGDLLSDYPAPVMEINLKEIHLARWEENLTRDSMPKDKKTRPKVYIPVNIPGIHWFLVVFKIRKGVVTFYDTLSDKKPWDKEDRPWWIKFRQLMSKQLRKGMSKHGVFKQKNIHPKGLAYGLCMDSPFPHSFGLQRTHDKLFLEIQDPVLMDGGRDKDTREEDKDTRGNTRDRKASREGKNHIRESASILHEDFCEVQTVHDIFYPTCRVACEALGLLGNDNEWDIAMQEASASATSSQLRFVFAHILTHCEVTDLVKLWIMSHNILERVSEMTHIPSYHLNDDGLQGYTLYEVEIILNNCGKSLQHFGLGPPPSGLLDMLANRLLMDERNYNQEELQQQRD